MAHAARHFLQFKDFARDEFEYLFERTRWIKAQFKRYEPLLAAASTARWR